MCEIHVVSCSDVGFFPEQVDFLFVPPVAHLLKDGVRDLEALCLVRLVTVEYENHRIAFGVIHRDGAIPTEWTLLCTIHEEF